MSSSEIPRIAISVVEHDGTTFDLKCTIGDAELNIITDAEVVGSDLILTGLHIDGPGPGVTPAVRLREAVRVWGRRWGVERVIIHGGQRTTGANPGHIPRPIIIFVNR